MTSAAQGQPSSGAVIQAPLTIAPEKRVLPAVEDRAELLAALSTEGRAEALRVVDEEVRHLAAYLLDDGPESQVIADTLARVPVVPSASGEAAAAAAAVPAAVRLRRRSSASIGLRRRCGRTRRTSAG